MKDKERMEWIERAREIHEKDGRVEIDDNAKVSEGDDPGVYVQAWVWVDAPEE